MHDAQEILLSEEALKKRREYFKRWRQEHRDRVKEYQARYWAKKAKEQSAEDDSEGER